MARDHRLSNASHGRRLAIRLGAAFVGASLALTATASAETEAPAPSALPVEILRGSVAPPLPRVEPGAGPGARVALAGDRLWIVDEAGGRLTGCRLINTAQVGGQAIRCTERPLPKGRPVRD